MSDKGKSSRKKVETCGTCDKAVTNTDCGVLCEMCEVWFHTGCQKVSEELYEILRQGQVSVHWFCNSCNRRVVQLVKSVAKLEAKQEKIEAAVNTVKDNVRKLGDELGKELSGIKQEIQRVEKSMEVLQEEFDNMVTRKINEFKESLSQGQNEAVDKDDVLEAVEIERRRMNLVIMGVTEEEKDKEAVNEILTKLIGNKVSASISSVERLGRKTGKIRPIRVVLNNLDVRYELLCKSKDLSKIDEFRKVFIMPDLTRKQQVQDKKLRDIVKELRDNGEKQVRIKKGKVIKVVNGREEIVFPPAS